LKMIGRSGLRAIMSLIFRHLYRDGVVRKKLVCRKVHFGSFDLWELIGAMCRLGDGISSKTVRTRPIVAMSEL